MQPKDAFAAISTTEKIASSLYKWMSGNRGIKRTVAIELKENIELMRLYVETGADPKELISKLSDVAFRSAIKEGFNFNSLNRSPIDKNCTYNIPQLKKYHGWNTQNVFENIYQKIATLKHATTIKNSKKPVRLGVRLNNAFKLMSVLALHIGD